MKKNIHILFLSVFAAVYTMTSCKELPQPVSQEKTVIEEGKVEDNNVEEGSFQEANARLTASADDFIVHADTKVSYQLSGNVMKFSWSDDDHIGIWPDQKDLLAGTTPQQASFYFKENANQANVAQFEACGWGLIRDKQYYAYHPFDQSATYNCVRIHYDWQRQTADNSTSHLAAYDYMQSVVDATDYNKGMADFKHLGCILAFTLNIPQDYRSFSFKSLTLSANSEIFVKEASYNPSLSNPSLSATQTSTDLSVSLGAENGSGFSCDADGKLRIFMSMSSAIGAASLKDKTISLTLTSSDERAFTAEITPDFAQQAGVLYPFSVDMQYSGPTATNLSLQESANSYIVTTAGDYMFRACKGNSSENVTPGSVKVLWESFNTSTAPSVNSLIKAGITYGNGYIFFSTADTFIKGNAVIAAYSGANYSGDILWSWHIWLTDRPADEEYPGGAGLLMDRNLGALSTSGNLANGLLYQWGRKDPMLGHTTTSSASAMAASENATTTQANSASVGTIAWSVKNPTKFIIGATNGDWLYVNPKAGTDYNIDNPDVDKSRWYGGVEVKTKYDPCPPGYMIPYSGPGVSDVDFWGKAYNISFRVTGTEYAFTLGGVNAPFTRNSGLYMPLANGQTSFYPIAGYISDGGVRNNDGKHFMMWTYFPAGSGGATVWNWQYSSCLDVNLLGGSAFTTHWNSTRADGKSVRCLRMKSSLQLGNEGFGTPIDSNW